MDRNDTIAALLKFCHDQPVCQACPLEYNSCDFDELSDEALNKCKELAQHHVEAEKKAEQDTMIENVCARIAASVSSPDPVNHPQHYELPGGLECFDVMLATQGVEAVQNFCLCNAFKYLFRQSRKNGLEDVKKARWYLDKYINLEEKRSKEAQP